MGFLISYEEKAVKAKGLNKLAIPDPEKVQQYFFPDEYQNLSLLSKLPKLKYPEHPVLLYPGCGADILFPLKYVEILFSRLRNITLIFNDLDNNLGLIKTILDEVGVSFKEKKSQITFYWNGVLIELKFIQGNIFQILPQIPAFDIYFERAFRIMKDEHENYENQVYQKLNSNGLLISDSGFQQLPLEKIKVSKELSSYQEMIIGIKRK
ncbi:MAG TPA: hypothetical protein VJB13_04650 [Candidatus Nanoarchaeia archaeon]|nr:hypothetical protein [Candidatus Nanoarchaeia archaeon]